ncbi:MAG TPA: enoyl-CoA hydratase-related protein [Acidimicrobiales bacterium]|jgi:enoyl-CoA hydratase/carnithine racemase|nr:enoyl-CoA hydratase-related protein [Acidimicrobiales bacterium]
MSFVVNEGVAIVRFERPERMNAWTVPMRDEFRSLMARVETDQDIRAVVVTGAGRAFCAGADSSTLDDMVGTGGLDESLQGPAADIFAEQPGAYAFMLAMSKPVIAAINGAAAGLGLVIACLCDVRFAATGVKLTTSMGRMGLPAEHGMSWILPRLIGAGRAADMLLSSRIVLAEEAERWGLVNQVCAPEDLIAAATDYARAIAQDISPASTKTIKHQLYADLHQTLPAALDFADAAMNEMLAGPDFREGVSAMTEHRKPNFAGS